MTEKIWNCYCDKLLHLTPSI